MIRRIALPALFLAASAAAAAPPTPAGMKDHARVLLVFAAPGDRALGRQQAILDGARQAVAERDIKTVRIVGDRVEGAADSATDLRHRYRVAPAAFTTVLVGKDGHEALRSTVPLSTARLFGTIDAMPMRQDEMKGQ